VLTRDRFKGVAEVALNGWETIQDAKTCGVICNRVLGKDACEGREVLQRMLSVAPPTVKSTAKLYLAIDGQRIMIDSVLDGEH
jgi:hypothetical protein